MIGNCAFDKCSSLTSIIIPLNVAYIGDCAFQGCSSLSSVTFHSVAVKFHIGTFSYCQKLMSVLLPGQICSIRSNTFEGCSQHLQDSFNRYTLLLSENRDSVVGVCEGFEGDLAIPEGVQRIEKNAFENSKISLLELPKTLKYIGESAFANCIYLRSASLPDSIEFIGEKAFFGCSALTGKIILPLNIRDINEYTFYGCTGVTSIQHSEVIGRVCRNSRRVGFHKPENSIVVSASSNQSVIQELCQLLNTFFPNSA